MNLTALVRAARRLARRPVATAFDNKQGTNSSDLWICRRIAALPTTNPDIARPANTYRRPGEETQ
jgi:hypothetical protein